MVIYPMPDGTRTVPGQSAMMYCSGPEYFSKVNMPSHRIEKTTYCEEYEAAGVIEKNSWNTYINTLNSLRLNDYISLYQTAYDRYVEANQ